MKKFGSLFLAICLLLSLGQAAFADDLSAYQKASSLMDLVSAASLYSVNSPESVPGEEGILSQSFIESFLSAGLVQSPEVGVSESLLTDTEAQQKLLSGIFTAKLPEAAIVTVSNENEEEANPFIGFQAQKAYTAENDDVQLIGGIYSSPKALSELSSLEFANVQWIETGIFTLRANDASEFGYLINGFSVGTDLSYEDSFRQYTDEVAVEYMSKLGFSVLYPSVFTDDTLMETEEGVSASLADGSASFSATRTANSSKATLASYAAALQEAHPNSILNADDEKDYATLLYLDGNGNAIFTVFVVTEDSVYSAELSCKEELLEEYSMFFSYLENSFVVNELSLG